ncbi:LOW QUALITY PROTEIN: G patch domain-containing protein 4 [Corapipo altera]|uniref:LOW QUALITY PROTEIN: G patch domain-containing protein 4 n=1 Tax=Corapipo altera TaxID=415028 RepID=UPI000FD6843D|nr:LOW QUALITY PROTEIN: G patch domain-containing protein 4 [Corapipo altera]
MSAPGPPGRGMRFAETQLRRHGWRRGQGLGKRQDGIAEAIRVKMKCDTAGVGHDAAEPFTFHWWDHVFNKAAANIAVEAGQDGISVKALSEQGGGISNKKPCKVGGTRDLLYGRFVKSATLTACGEESMTLPTGSESSEEEEKLDLSSARRLTDEELVQACGGRTAHKGARHGLTMSAKLARLEEQERAFLAMYRHKERQQELLKSSPLAESQGKKKKKRKKSRDRADPEVPQSQESNGEEEEVSGKEVKVVKRKKKKIREPSGEEELMGEGEKVMRKKVTEPCGEEEASGEEGKVMKRRKKPEAHTEQEVAEEEGKAAKRKKKKKQKQEEEEDKEEPAETDIPLEGTGEPDLGHSPRKKRKKKKRKREPE